MARMSVVLPHPLGPISPVTRPRGDRQLGIRTTSRPPPISPGRLVPALLAEGVDGLGERLVRTLLELFDRPAAFAPFLALIRGASSNDHAAAMLRAFIAREVLGRVAAAADARPPGRPLEPRRHTGRRPGDARYVVGVPPLATTDRETVVACLGP